MPSTDGEYEFQFDRFESTDDYHDRVVFLTVDTEKSLNKDERFVGDVVLPTADIPEIDSNDAVGTAIFHGTVEDNELVELVYNPELTEQRITEAEEQYERIRATPNDNNTDSGKSGDV